MQFAEADGYVGSVVRVDENVPGRNFSVHPREKPVEFDRGNPIEVFGVIDHHVFPDVILRSVIVVSEFFIAEFFGKRLIHDGDLHGRVIFHAVLETGSVVHLNQRAVIVRHKQRGRKEFERNDDREIDDKRVKRNIPRRF